MDDGRDDDERRARAKERASWPVVVTTLDRCDGERPDDDGFVDATPGERLAILTALSRQAFALSGKPMPTFAWRDAPGRVLRNWPSGD